MVYEGYWNYSYSSWAIDLGTLYRTGFRGLNIAMSILNFGPEVKFSGDYIDYSDPLSYIAQPEPEPKSFEKYSLPINFRFGVSMDLINTGAHRLISAFDMVHPNNNLEQYNIGFEYSMNRMFYLRSGYRFNTDEGGLSLGAGINLKMGESFNLRTDYSYADMGILKSIHRFSVGFDF